MEITKGFFAKMVVFAGVFIGEVTLATRDEVEEFVSVEGRIDKEGVKVESQDEEGWDFSDESSLSLQLSWLCSCLVVSSFRTPLLVLRHSSFRLVPMSCRWLGTPST